jgi:hypothetical protein
VLLAKEFDRQLTKKEKCGATKVAPATQKKEQRKDVYGGA